MRPYGAESSCASGGLVRALIEERRPLRCGKGAEEEVIAAERSKIAAQMSRS